MGRRADGEQPSRERVAKIRAVCDPSIGSHPTSEGGLNHLGRNTTRQESLSSPGPLPSFHRCDHRAWPLATNVNRPSGSYPWRARIALSVELGGEAQSGRTPTTYRSGRLSQP